MTVPSLSVAASGSASSSALLMMAGGSGKGANSAAGTGADIPLSLSAESPLVNSNSNVPPVLRHSIDLLSPGTSPPGAGGLLSSHPGPNASAAGGPNEWSWGWGSLPKRTSSLERVGSDNTLQAPPLGPARTEFSPQRGPLLGASSMASSLSAAGANGKLLPPEAKGAGWRARMGSMLGMWKNPQQQGVSGTSPMPARATSEPLGTSAPGRTSALAAALDSKPPSPAIRRVGSKNVLSKSDSGSAAASSIATGVTNDDDSDNENEPADDDDLSASQYYDAIEPEMPPVSVDREGAGGRLIYEHDKDVTATTPVASPVVPPASAAAAAAASVAGLSEKELFEDKSALLFSPPGAPSRLIFDSASYAAAPNMQVRFLCVIVCIFSMWMNVACVFARMYVP